MSTTVTVKPLVWTLRVDEMVLALWDTMDPWGKPLFEINRFEGDNRFHLSRRRTGAPSKPFPTLEAAQQAAQEQWETFVRAAIEVTP